LGIIDVLSKDDQWIFYTIAAILSLGLSDIIDELRKIR